MFKSFFLTFSLLSISAVAGERTTVHCSMEGRNGQPAFAKAELVFDLAQGRDELRAIFDLRGEVRAAQGERELNTEDAYIGIFEIPQVTENPKYRPVKYKNSSQFKDINAKETRGSEQGMWGNLIVPRDIRGAFESHFVFQAGDHMGGTIHLNCRAER